MKRIQAGPKPKFFKVTSTQLTNKVQLVLLNNRNIIVRYPLEPLANLFSLDFLKIDNSKLTDTNSQKVIMRINPKMVDTVHDK